MLIEIYPKPDGMQHINLMFCEAEPDPEDGGSALILTRFPPRQSEFLKKTGPTGGIPRFSMANVSSGTPCSISKSTRAWWTSCSGSA